MAAAMCGMRKLTFCRLREMRLMFVQSRTKWKSGDRRKENEVTQERNKAIISSNKRRNDKVADMTYKDMIDKRLEQADRSLLLLLNRSRRDYLIDVLSHVEKKIGPIEKTFYIKNYARNDLLLIEFSSEEKLEHTAASRVLGTSQIKKVKKRDESLIEKITEYEPEPFKPQTLNNCASVTSQMMRLYQTRKLSEAVTRLQFFISMLLYRSIKEAFKEVQILPFGSWSCGLAIDGTSDVDVSIMHNYNQDILRDVFKLFKKNSLFEKVTFLGHARVPIVKVTQRQTEVSCDINSNGLPGVMIAEVLYLMRKKDPAFYPLVLTLKILAREHSLTASGPSFQFSSFMLTMMVLSYLQQEGTLPALKTVLEKRSLLSANSSTASRVTESKEQILKLDNVFASKPLGELLVGFFSITVRFHSKVILWTLIMAKLSKVLTFTVPVLSILSNLVIIYAKM